MKKGNGSGIMEKLKVVIENKQKTVKIPTGIRLLIRRCCHAVLEMENFEGSVEVDVSLVDNAQIREINREHRHIDAVTDVLSFPLGENGHYDINPETGAKMLGDVVLSMERAMEPVRAVRPLPSAGGGVPHRAFHPPSAGLRSRGRRAGSGTDAGTGGSGDVLRGPAPGRKLRHAGQRPVIQWGFYAVLFMPGGAFGSVYGMSGISASIWWRPLMC